MTCLDVSSIRREDSVSKEGDFLRKIPSRGVHKARVTGLPAVAVIFASITVPLFLAGPPESVQVLLAAFKRIGVRPARFCAIGFPFSLGPGGFKWENGQTNNNSWRLQAGNRASAQHGPGMQKHFRVSGQNGAIEHEAAFTKT